jgi:2,3-bisphosphoglycerate-dependent phosphoglycerate mutase
MVPVSREDSTLILVRHGQSQWNLENRFTGWVDVPLTEKGEAEARRAGELLLKAKTHVDVAFTSDLVRAQRTLGIVLEVLHQTPPVAQSQALNERHYGDLQGLSKKQMVRQVGVEQVALWRRSYSSRPPKISKHLYQQFIADPRYQELSKNQMPWSESLADTYK